MVSRQGDLVEMWLDKDLDNCFKHWMGGPEPVGRYANAVHALLKTEKEHVDRCHPL